MASSVLEVIPSSNKTLLDARWKKSSGRTGTWLFLAALTSGLIYVGFHIARDLSSAALTSVWPYLLLGTALAIALGFEFVNGFHDTANAVATVIYTNSLSPKVAVVLSGLCNLAGVLLSSGTVAFAVVTLLPVELILKVSSGAGFSMIFALLIAAILWNLGTWYLGLPASSSHTLVGSIIGVGLANQLMNPHLGASGLDWAQVIKVLKALLISPLLGFALAGALILLSRRFLQRSRLDEAPKGNEPPPWPIRALMIGTCTGVSFFHGSNDGQKGMGLIMLILIGTVPTAYALNHSVGPMEARSFLVASADANQVLDRYVKPDPGPDPDPRTEIMTYIRTGKLAPGTLPAMQSMIAGLDHEVEEYKALESVPAHDQTNIRNDMYVTSEAFRLMLKNGNPGFTPAEAATVKRYETKLDKSTKYIPNWVKVAVALALGLGTMVGWKRIVVTVGEKIGKEHLTYAQGASAGLVTMVTIFAADTWGLPVSTTHILSSGVAGTMAANGSGLRLKTVRNIAAGWVFTLPAAALLSGTLYFVFHSIL
jgi:PiT family inorganic phosphate transporter